MLRRLRRWLCPCPRAAPLSPLRSGWCEPAPKYRRTSEKVQLCYVTVRMNRTCDPKWQHLTLTDLHSSCTGLKTLKGSMDSIVPASAQASAVTQLLQDNMGIFNIPNEFKLLINTCIFRSDWILMLSLIQNHNYPLDSWSELRL